MKKIEKHQRSNWTPEKDTYLKECFFPLVKNRLDSITRAKHRFPNIDLSLVKLDPISGMGLAHHYGSSNEVYNFLYYANQLSRSWLTIAMNDGKPVTIQIADKTFDTIGEYSSSYTGISDVLSGLWAAIVLRDSDAIQFYVDIPFEFTEKTSGVEDILFEYMFIFYKSLYPKPKGKGDARYLIEEMDKKMVWENYRKTVSGNAANTNFSEAEYREMLSFRSQLVRHIYQPVLWIYDAILTENQAAYEEAVYQALVKWKEYYTLTYTDEQGEEWDHSKEPLGYLALPIAAACAYAYDKGMKLQTVESDYIPKWMVEGRFEEFELLIKE